MIRLNGSQPVSTQEHAFLTTSRYVRPSLLASQSSQEKSMKTILTGSLLLLGALAAVGQTQQPTAADSSETRNNAPERHHNYGWIGLIGLAGLVGLRRQRSVEHQRMAASGIKVKTVDAT